jgi:hypothetical protein
MFNSVKNSFDYIPWALVMIIFLSESKIIDNCKNNIWVTVNSFLSLLLFFLLYAYYGLSKTKAGFVVLLFWISLTIIRKRILINRS